MPARDAFYTSVDVQPRNLGQRLEHENRWVKRVGPMAGVLLVAVILIGAAVPEEIPERVDARNFRVVDENGKNRAAKGKQDENGNVRSAMDAEGLSYLDQNGNARALRVCSVSRLALVARHCASVAAGRTIGRGAGNGRRWLTSQGMVTFRAGGASGGTPGITSPHKLTQQDTRQLWENRASD